MRFRNTNRTGGSGSGKYFDKGQMTQKLKILYGIRKCFRYQSRNALKYIIIIINSF